jgi:mono/diheme cytochrome c family protein
MSVRTILLAAAAAIPLAGLAAQSSPPPAGNGQALYQEKCAMCHGRVGMGTGLLARRVQPPMLAERTDLTADYVVQAARSGIGNMPAISRGEASDAQLDAIAAWLAAGPTARK